MTKDIFRNKRDFARAEFATEFQHPQGHPHAREAHAQRNQQSSHQNQGIKSEKVSFKKKAGSPEK